MQNDLNPPPKRRTALVLAMGLIATVLVGIISTIDSTSIAQRNGRVLNLGDSIDTCDLLGIEYGNFGGTVAGTQSKYPEYFGYEMGVSSTLVDRGTPMSEINAGISTAGTETHVLRFGNDYGSVDAVAAKIEEIMRDADSPGTLLVMPTNEPGSELRRYFYGDAWKTSPDATPEQIATWLNQLVDKLKASSNPDVSDTSSYLVFPAINIEKPSGPTYVSGELETKGIAQNLNDGGAFHSFGLSVQHTTPSSDFSAEINKYKAALGNKYNGKLLLYGVAGGSKGFDEGAYESLQQAIESFKSELTGIYFFSPWGWSDPDGIAPSNPAMDTDIWDRLFTSCGRKDNKCGLTDYDDQAGLQSCQRIEVGGGYDEIRSGVPVTFVKRPVDNKLFEAHAVVTQKVTTFGLLDWLSSSNYAQTSAPQNGTDANPYLPPCARDLQIATNDAFGFVDMSNVFRGPIKLINTEDEFEYQMPQLGNAIGCLVWRAKNTEPGSKSPTQLAKGFRSDAPIEPEVSARKFQGLIGGFVAPSKTHTLNGPYCSGLVDRTENSDRVSGEELIIRDDILVMSRIEMCDRIKRGDIVVGTTLAHKQAACPPTAANPNGVYRGDTLGMRPYLAVQENGTENVEIPGLLEGLKQLYIEEAEQFPWDGRYRIIHRDKAGIKVSLQKKLYDGNTRKVAGSSYSSPLTTAATPSCQVKKYDGGLKAPTIAGGKVSGQADYIFPFVGQAPKMMARISLNFTSLENGNYIQIKKDELKAVEDAYNKASTQEQKKQALDAIIVKVTKQDDLFLCSDLDALAGRLKDKKLSEAISQVDCMGLPDEADPFADWLCSKDVFKSAHKRKFCVNSCLDLTPGEIAQTLPLEEVKGQLGRPVPGNYTVRGTYILAHPGIDIAVPTGTPVLASEAGIVDFVRDIPGNVNGRDTYLARVGVDNAPYYAAYGNLVVIKHSDYYTFYAHLKSDSTTLRVGQAVNKGQKIAEVGNTGMSSGAHLHFEIRKELDGEICSVYSSPLCTVDPAAYLSSTPAVEGAAAVTQVDSSFLCRLPNGDLGVSARINSLQRPATRASFGDVSEASSMVINSCGVRIRECDQNCFQGIKDGVMRIADFNISVMGSKYNTTNYYSREEISAFMDEMYRESQTINEPPFQLMIAIWLSENGMNPVFKNPSFTTDVFGCGVKCPRPPENFREELACVTRKLEGCSVLHTWDPSRPGEYLEKYGPIADGNGSFSAKTLMTLEAISSYQGEATPRIQTDQCNLYANYGDSIPDNLNFVTTILDRGFNYEP